MAARQSVLKPAPRRPELDRLMTASIKAGVTDDQLQDQRVSFAYGNAPEGSKITKIRRARRLVQSALPAFNGKTKRRGRA